MSDRKDDPDLKEDERYERFRQDGYVLIENVLAGEALAHVQAAFERVRSATEPAWRAMVASGEYRGGYGNGPDAHSMEDPYLEESVFLDLAEHPAILPFLTRIIGPGMQVTEIFAHSHPPGSGAHTAWHRDWPTYRHPKYVLKAKAFFFLDDQTPDMGCFSLVPGTQHRDEFPPQDYLDDTLEDMPGMERMVCPAGSVLIWDVTLWHTATANRSERDRRILIYGYQPFFIRNWESRTPPPVVVDWANTPARRQLMGIHAVDGRAGWDRHDVPYLPEHEAIARAKVI
ncbi:MAG: phytanoyl-CoA dioxygenase family protein [Pseudomonadota bacterium]